LTGKKRSLSQIPRKTPRRRVQPARRFSIVVRISLVCFGLFAALLIWAIAARTLAPLSNTNRQSFDAIVVLGTPADSDGNPTPELLDRITEGVHEYERGIAPRIIVTGAAAHNRFVEAEVMARVAEAQGVPASVIVQEAHALDTIQNACYSTRILESRGWHSVEVVSSAYHLPRAAIIFAHLAADKPSGRLEWRMHPAPANLTPDYWSLAAKVVETLKTARYLVWSRWTESCAL
jgi:uncharacterized SAM-binding protein YcdF (DUF218 family)